MDFNTTDGLDDFEKLHYFPNVALAVSKMGKMEVGMVYEAPGGGGGDRKCLAIAVTT